MLKIALLPNMLEEKPHGCAGRRRSGGVKAPSAVSSFGCRVSSSPLPQLETQEPGRKNRLGPVAFTPKGSSLGRYHQLKFVLSRSRLE